MITVFQLSDIPYLKNSVVTVGTFDGVHLAHQQLLREVVDRARARSGRSIVLTFEPHPKEVLTGNPMQLLTTPEERQQICEQLGIEVFFRIEFTYDFSRLTSREFYLRYLVQGCGVSEVVEGYDHHFGRDREGSVEALLSLGREFEFSVAALKPVYVDEEIVSSSQIRQHLLHGRVDRAQRLLGRPYSSSGTVIRGDGRGRELGYPTANLHMSSSRKLIPSNGIYFAQVDIGGPMYFGLVSIGVRPTFFEKGKRMVEVYLLDFDGDLYGRTISVQFLKRLRDERKFEGARQLIEQMDRDKEESRKLESEFRAHLRQDQKKS
ncbi:MAG: riboflavin biosynthesis protein RibF [Ignavibacteria bacterium GWA2_54_16]|nr:MAG: riboflavin biosynthesis protein RibF [Ignavibacteria bacterium GWA2_54_16]